MSSYDAVITNYITEELEGMTDFGRKHFILSLYSADTDGYLSVKNQDKLNTYLHTVLKSFGLTPKRLGAEMYDALYMMIDQDEIDQAFTVLYQNVVPREWWGLTGAPSELPA